MIDAVVLAAGFGTRMGRIKPLASVHGRPSLAVVLDRLRAAGIVRPIVVLGHAAEEIAAAIDLTDARVVTNPDPARGLSSSLRLGIASVAPEAIGTLLLHADMPTISAGTLRAVIAAAENGAPIAAPCHRGTRGFPVFLGRGTFSELDRILKGDVGAKKYLRAHQDELVLVDVDDPGCLVDFDRPEDLRRLAERGMSCGTSA